MLTQTAKYAIRALVYLAQQDPDVFCQTKDIAKTIHVPANYLGKTMQKLAHARILDSQKGLHGGFHIARTPNRITLHEIMVAIEAIPRDMADDPSSDSDELPSEVYARLTEISAQYTQALKQTTLADLLPEDALVKAPTTPAAAAV